MRSAAAPPKPSIFIASSSSSIPVAQAVKLQFDAEANVQIWYENVFKINENTLQTLLNRASYYDYFIAVFSADDKAIINRKLRMVVRDNVIFEFGLFLGRLGLGRTFFVLEDGVNLFSDWNGITITRFSRGDNLVAAVGASCIRIREKMRAAEKVYNYTVLPSTALAIGYYNNFLQPVLTALQNEKTIEILEKDNTGAVIGRFTQQISLRFPTIEIRVPRDLSHLERDKLNLKTRDFKQLIINTKIRHFPFYVQGTFGENCELHLFDIPTTLLASYYTIKEFFTPSFLAEENVFQQLMDREIRNFDKTLSKLIPTIDNHKFYSFTIQ